MKKLFKRTPQRLTSSLVMRTGRFFASGQTIKFFFQFTLISISLALFGQSTASIKTFSESVPQTIDNNFTEVDYSYEGLNLSGYKSTIINHQTLIQLGSTDENVEHTKIEYRIDDSTPISYTQPFTVDVEGKHIVKYEWIDNHNYRREVQFPIIVDKSGPMIQAKIEYRSITLNEFSLGGDGRGNLNKKLTFPLRSVIHIVATDFIAGVTEVRYKIDNAPEQNYKDPIVLNAKGAHVIFLRAVDKLGNETISGPIEFETIIE